MYPIFILFTLSITFLIGYVGYVYLYPLAMVIEWVKLFLMFGAILIFMLILFLCLWLLEHFGSCLVRPFKFVGSGIGICFGMVYATYKEFCPIITWRDE